MTTRRKLFSSLAALPFVGGMFGSPQAQLASGSEILKSFDARDWAKHFVAHAKAIPGLATDEGTMIGWFANAMMRGHDEHSHYVDTEVKEAGMTRMQYLSERSIRHAVAQGWCDETTQHKEMDCILAEAICQRLFSMTGTAPPPEQFETVIYPCGCKAGPANVTLSGPLPRYCSEHGIVSDEDWFHRNSKALQNLRRS